MAQLHETALWNIYLILYAYTYMRIARKILIPMN